MEISDLSIAQLEQELLHRKSIQRQKEEQEENDRKFKEWQERPACHLVGRAYGPTMVQSETLVSATVAGNGSSSYTYMHRMPQRARTYFHNLWNDSLRREFSELITNTVEYFLESRIEKSADLCAELILACRPVIGEDRYDTDWRKAAIEKLAEFSIDELYEAKKLASNQYKREKEKLLMEALTYKKKNTIPDKPKKKLPKEQIAALTLKSMAK